MGQHFSQTEVAMRFIRWAVLLLIVLTVIGFYRGWFMVTESKPEPTNDKVNVTVSVDKDKMKSDVNRAKEKVKEEVREIKNKVNAQKSP
jgi:hypothetical protein